jgi:PTS system glucitol/sorbitol-specific IIA component
MKYKSVITGIGPEALEFLSPELDLNFVIIFNEDAPAELAELAILHTNAALEGMPAVGDTFKLGKKTYKITAVGTEAPHTLATLGHCTLAFSPDETAYRPGCIMLDGAPVTRDDLPVGETIEIY